MIGNSIERPSGGAAFCGIAVMAKASAAGSTKTRLVPPLTYSEAAAFNTAFLKDVAQNILTAGRRASIAGYMAYGPPSGATFLRENIPPELGLFEASSPNFGDCLYSAICELLKRSHCSAIVLNSDSPTLPDSTAARSRRSPGAPRRSSGARSCHGRRLLPAWPEETAPSRLFEDIAWSTSRVAEQTFERARELGLKLHLLAPWYDVDDAEGLGRLDVEITSRLSSNPALQPYEARHTAQLLRSIFGSNGCADRLGATGREKAKPLLDGSQVSTDISQRIRSHVEPNRD
jgi:uncharacterized protein